MSVDVVTKFTYLEYGKKAPKHSSYKGLVSTKSLIGFTNYGKREESRELSSEAKNIIVENKNFFDYTNQRLGATKTYSSIGWINTPKKDSMLRKQIAKSFKKDGDIVWVPVLSLKDFMTSTEMKLFNEEDYAAIFDKILPKWFASSGFKNDNMLWWMDHHVNTDNPHIHFCFLENEKTKLNGKLPMKNINGFKNMFWKEVFSKKRYLEETGRTVEEGFKNKDMLKQETYKTFKDEIRKCSGQEFIEQIKSLYKQLPQNGRLQYNSSQMIPYRSDIDKIVNYLLNTPNVDERYQEFLKSLNEFDETRRKAIKTEGSIKNTEDKKLRAMLANAILSEFKNINQEFWKSQLNGSIKGNESNTQNATDLKSKCIPIAGSLILNRDDEQLFVRLPSNSEYIFINLKNCTLISEEKQFYVARIYENDKFEVFDRKGNGLDSVLDIYNIHEFFDDGQPYLDSMLERENDKALRAALWNQRMMEWTQSKYDWSKSVKGIKNASFSWMNEIEHEVNRSRNEFLDGKEYIV